MSFAIRTARTADVPAMHQVRNKVRENRLSDPDQVSQASYLPYLKAGSIWVAETQLGIVGFAALDGDKRNVWALFVDPEAEGIGTGRALHHRMLNWAQEQGFKRLALSTESGTRAAKFYRRAGWTEVGSTHNGETSFELELLSQGPLSSRRGR